MLSAPESGAPLSALLPEILPESLPVPESASLDELAPDPPLDEDVPEPLPEPPPDEEDEEDVPLEPPLLGLLPDLAPLELGLAPEVPLPDPPVEDGDVASVAPPSFVELAPVPVASNCPPHPAPPSWPRAVTAMQARIA
jgi:hypothetical protein